MSDIPENIDLNGLGRRMVTMQDDMRALRSDMDILILLTTLDAVREDIRALWTGQGELRRRIEALEARDGR